MKSSQFTLHTKDGKTLQAYRWHDESVQAKGVIHIAHGMAEHSLRYKPFIQFLTANGFIVYANDHRGHGKSCTDETTKGFFAKQNGFEKVVDDLVLITKQIIDEEPNLPLFLFGHSMGSLLILRLIQRYKLPIAVVILSGTAGDPKFIGKIGLLIAKVEKLFRGPKAKSPLMDRLIFG